MNMCLTGVMSFDLGVRVCARIKELLVAARAGKRDPRVAASKCCSSKYCFVKMYREHEGTILDVCTTTGDVDALFAMAVAQGSPLEVAIEGIYVMSESLRGKHVIGGRAGVIDCNPVMMPSKCYCWHLLMNPKPRAPR